MTENLEQFASDFLASRTAYLQVLEFRNSGNRASIIAKREGRFQAELVLWGPNLVLPAHRHPHINALESHVSGDMILVFGDTEQEANDFLARASVWPSRKLHGRFIPVRPQDWHGGKTGPTGASFWSIQEWSGDEPMTAAGVDWDSSAVLPVPALARLCV